MGRPANPQAKAELLGKVTAYILQHGLTDLSLRPLATAVGASPRLLLYHFGSKERLVTEVLTHIFQQQAHLFAAPNPAWPPAQRLDALWEQLTSPRMQPFLRSLFEVELRAMEGNQHYSQFAAAALQGWMDIAAGQLRSGTPEGVVRVLLSSLTGLLVVRFATGDEVNTDAGYRALRGMLLIAGHL